MVPERFEVGGRNENRKGPYEVLEIRGDMMRIRWDTGEEIQTDVKGQLKVLRNMEREFEASTRGPTRRVPRCYGELFTGMTESDFSRDVTGTHWRAREQLGGAVVKHIASSFPMNSWAIYKRAQVHWASRDRYPKHDAWFQAKFAASVNEERMWAGFYVERSSESDDPSEDWDNFLAWLEASDSENTLAGIMREQPDAAERRPDWV